MAGAAPGTTLVVDFICCQTRGRGKPSLSFSIGLKLPDAPFKCSKLSKPLETCHTRSWSCQTSSCGKLSLSFSIGLKLPDAPFTRFKPSKPLETCQTAAVGAVKLGAVASQIFLSDSWNCQTTGSRKPSGSFSAAKLIRSCGKPSLSCRLLELPNYAL